MIFQHYHPYIGISDTCSSKTEQSSVTDLGNGYTNKGIVAEYPGGCFIAGREGLIIFILVVLSNHFHIHLRAKKYFSISRIYKYDYAATT